jgi:hypothetical protein
LKGKIYVPERRSAGASMKNTKTFVNSVKCQTVALKISNIYKSYVIVPPPGYMALRTAEEISFKIDN